MNFLELVRLFVTGFIEERKTAATLTAELEAVNVYKTALEAENDQLRLELADLKEETQEISESLSALKADADKAMQLMQEGLNFTPVEGAIAEGLKNNPNVPTEGTPIESDPTATSPEAVASADVSTAIIETIVEAVAVAEGIVVTTDEAADLSAAANIETDELEAPSETAEEAEVADEVEPLDFVAEPTE